MNGIPRPGGHGDRTRNPASAMLADSVDIILELSAQREVDLNRNFSGRTPRSIADTIGKTIEASGIVEGAKACRSLHASQPNAYNFSAGRLDALARSVSARHKLRDALEVFKLNAAAFPQSSAVAQGVRKDT